jgi:hypothetical protein
LSAAPARTWVRWSRRFRRLGAADRQLNRDEALVITAITHAVLTRDVQVNLQPSLSDVASDKAVPFLDGCAPS